MISWNARRENRARMNTLRLDRFAIQSDFATFSYQYKLLMDNTGDRFSSDSGTSLKGDCLMAGASTRKWIILGYLRPRSRLYWPPYLLRFAASSVISGIQLANTAYTPTIIRCRQNRPLAWIFLLFFLFLSFAFLFVLSHSTRVFPVFPVMSDEEALWTVRTRRCVSWDLYLKKTIFSLVTLKKKKNPI